MDLPNTPSVFPIRKGPLVRLERQQHLHDWRTRYESTPIGEPRNDRPQPDFATAPRTARHPVETGERHPTASRVRAS